MEIKTKKRKIEARKIDLDSIIEGTLIEQRDFMFKVDREKAFKKLSEKQFKRPSLGLREIVVNSLDSYRGLEKIPYVDITLDDHYCEITDFGSGFTEEKIEVLRTLGRSDKREKKGYVGRFGVGFASIFHPDLKVKYVRVDTMIDGAANRLEFVVDKSKINLKRYRFDAPFEFSTRTTIEFDNPNKKALEEMEATLTEEAGYMNADIILNGYNIGGEKLFKGKREHQLELDGEISGRLCFYNPNSPSEKDTKNGIALLSGNVYVTKQNDYEFFDSNFNFPSCFGFLNFDGLNVITSRDDFKKDMDYTRFSKTIEEKINGFFKAKCKEARTKCDTQLREILLMAFVKNSARCFDYLRRDSLKEGEENTCTAELVNVPLFESLSKKGTYYSLRELNELIKTQGHFVYAKDKDSAEFINDHSYQGPIILEPFSYIFSGLDGAINANLFINGNFNKERYEKLIKKKLIDPDQIKIGLSPVDDSNLDSSETHFLQGVRGILLSEKVKSTLRKEGLATDYSVQIADVTPSKVAACYSDSSKVISLNRRNPCTSGFIKSQHKLAPILYLPIAGHELTHGKYSMHDNQFYGASSDLTSKILVALAEDMIESEI